jgi:hypothetical protein
MGWGWGSFLSEVNTPAQLACSWSGGGKAGGPPQPASAWQRRQVSDRNGGLSDDSHDVHATQRSFETTTSRVLRMIE